MLRDKQLQHDLNTTLKLAAISQSEKSKTTTLLCSMYSLLPSTPVNYHSYFHNVYGIITGLVLLLFTFCIHEPV